MLSTAFRGFLGVLVMNTIVAAGTPTKEELTDEETALFDWASGFQVRAQAICDRISVPERHVAEDRIAQAVYDMADTRKERLDISMNALGHLADHGQVPRMVPASRGPGLEREVTLRQNQLLRAWSQAQEEHSPDRVVAVLWTVLPRPSHKTCNSNVFGDAGLLQMHAKSESCHTLTLTHAFGQHLLGAWRQAKGEPCYKRSGACLAV